MILGLASRFGPIPVQNTSGAPMDFRKFMEFTGTWKLHADTWNLVGEHKEPMRSDTSDLLLALLQTGDLLLALLQTSDLADGTVPNLAVTRTNLFLGLTLGF